MTNNDRPKNKEQMDQYDRSLANKFAEDANQDIKKLASPGTDQIMNLFEMLDAEDTEILLHRMADFFLLNAEMLSNMDAVQIASHLLEASQLVADRSGN